MKVSLTVLLLQHFLLVAFCASQQSSLAEIHFSDVRNAPSGIGMRHLVACQLPSLQFWLVSKIFRVVSAFHRRVPIPDELPCDGRISCW